MKLPLEFLDRMKSLLDVSEYEDFINSFDSPRFYGLRVNTLKISVEDFLKISPFNLTPIPWVKDGFYYSYGDSPGKHPYYHAGLYYIQEPSAMYPGAVIETNPYERVLDLCAAPGGKSVQIAAGLNGKGVLVANDISADRVKALIKNIELCGIRNAVVTNETPEKLAIRFRGYFDKILVDAPCSGEGMFRKDEDAVKSWSNFKNDKCVQMQTEILEYVDKMLRPGGVFVYSTCTFAPEEDEKMISWFLEKHSNYEICEIPKSGGIENGRPAWSDGNEELKKTARLWPHKLNGEGHFTAMLRKKEMTDQDYSAQQIIRYQSSNIPEEFYKFVKDNLNIEIEGRLELKGNNLYYLPEETPILDGIKVSKFGWYLGEFNRGKFDPSHSMIISLKKEDIKNVVDFSSSSKDVISYLKGETLMQDSDTNGFVGICVDSNTLGWAKFAGGIFKNLYPKGWRRMS